MERFGTRDYAGAVVDNGQVGDQEIDRGRYRRYAFGQQFEPEWLKLEQLRRVVRECPTERCEWNESRRSAPDSPVLERCLEQFRELLVLYRRLNGPDGQPSVDGPAVEFVLAAARERHRVVVGLDVLIEVGDESV
jgi:hypothetical protein